MTIYALINKEVIPYICKGKKVTTEYICAKTNQKADKVDKWLDIKDPKLPTIKQAKELAKCLHIPFAGLYMNTEDININSIPSIKNFRTLDGVLSIDNSGLNIAIVDVLQERDFLIAESNELGLPLIAFSSPSCPTEDPTDWAKMIREHFSISIDDQYKCNSTRKFYLYLRDRIERKGVFVQCFTDVPVETVRGFSIYEQQLPIIGINDDDRPPAKSFSLIHELVHLIKRESSVCDSMFDAVSPYQEEVFCNAVAGELLVPKDALAIVLDSGNYAKPYRVKDIVKIAKKFSVSKEVIIRRLLDNGKINKIEYGIYSEEFKKEPERDKEAQRLARNDGIKTRYFKNISREAIDRTSPSICKALYYGYCEEIYSKRDIAQHLGIAQKHVDKFLMEVSLWNS